VDQDVVEIPLDGSAMRTLLATSQAEHCAAWSPKGDQFVYSKAVGGTNEIWTHNVRDGSDRPLVTAAAFHEGPTDRLTEPRYSPDGQRVVFTRISGGVYSLWVMSALGGTPVPLVPGAMAGWSPDGSWVVYHSAPQFGLLKVPAGGGKPVELAPPGIMIRPQWSPRGDWITYLDRQGLKIISPDGSRTELLSGESGGNDDESGWNATAGFSQDGSTVYAVRTNKKHHLLLEAIDIASKRRRVVSDLGVQQDTHGFSLAPDGKSFLTTLAHIRGDIWLLDGFPNP
jgi:Tol biopolymer transport system component